MTFRPKSNSKKEVMLSAAMAFCAVLLFVVAGIIRHFVVVYQLTAVVLAVISIEIYMKYVGSDYIYEVADDGFKVYKVTGKKSICVSCLDYEMSISGVVSDKEYLADKSIFPKTNFNVNFCKNLSPKQYYVYFFEFNGKKSMMKFEPDDAFVDCLNDKIAEAMDFSDREEEY